jgi:heptosyltransferase-2
MSRRTNPPLPSDLESLLIVCPSWVGDSVMATPILRAARLLLPETRLIVAARRGLDGLLRGAPWLDELITLDMGGLLGPLHAAAAIRRRRPQAALLLPNSFRSALAVRLSGTPIRIGYDRDGRGVLLTHRLAVQRSQAPTPAIEYYARLGAYALGEESLEKNMELFVSAEETAEADRLLADVHGPFIVLNPGASKPAKRWPAARFARVADALHESHGLRAVVSGGPGEKDILDAVVGAADSPVIDLARRGVNLASLKAVIKRSSLLITNDTGPRHIAAALGTPVVSLFGPTDHRWTALAGVSERILLAEPFLPDELTADRHPKLCAIDRIAVSDVIAAAKALLGASPTEGR